MPFDNSHGRNYQSVRVPLRVIDAAFGGDKYDNAGDDMVFCLREVSDFPSQFRAEFTLDTSHENPWYHVLVFTVHGISEFHYTRLVKLLANYGLLEDASG